LGISPGPSFPKRGMPPFGKGRSGGIFNGVVEWHSD